MKDVWYLASGTPPPPPNQQYVNWNPLPVSVVVLFIFVGKLLHLHYPMLISWKSELNVFRAVLGTDLSLCSKVFVPLGK